MLRPRGYKDIKSKWNSLTLSTQELETISLEESTISYFALMSQLGIPLQNLNNCRTSSPHIELLSKTSEINKTPSPNKVPDLLSTKKFQPINRPLFKT
jgi:hypothetical protein